MVAYKKLKAMNPVLGDSGGRGRIITDFEANQGYIVRPCVQERKMLRASKTGKGTCCLTPKFVSLEHM